MKLALAFDHAGIANESFTASVAHHLENSDRAAAFVGLRGHKPEEVEASFAMVGQQYRHQVLVQALEAFMDLHRLSPSSCSKVCPPLPTLLALVRHVRPYRLTAQDLPSPHLWRHQVLLACQIVATLSLEGRYRLHPQLVAHELELIHPATLPFVLGDSDIPLVGELCMALRTLGLDQGTNWIEAQAFLLRTQMEDGGWPPPPPSSTSTPLTPLGEARCRLLTTASSIRGLCRMRTKGYGPVYNPVNDKLRRVLAPYTVITADGKIALKPPPRHRRLLW